MFEIENLSKVYIAKTFEGVLAINDISLNIQDKGMVFVLGKSGSGKSTFLNLLGGLDKYDEGEIKVYGKSTKDFTQADFDAYRNSFVGFIFQDYNILEGFTVAQNLALAIQLQGKKPTDKMLNDILREVDLAGYGKRRPNELSGGQLQRVAVARALIKNPEVIMADEPTGALDSQTGIQVFDTLKKISKNKLVLVVSHDREFAEQYADRIIEFADGKIISDVEKIPVQKSGLDSAIKIDENKVTVKKNYKLTAKDFATISHYIEKNDDTTAKEKKQKYVFKEIDSKIVLPQKPNKALKKEKSRLPWHRSFKIGVSSFRNKKIRLVITILLSTIAFSLFGVFATLADYKDYKVMANAVIENQIDYLNIQKNRYYQTSYFENIRNCDVDYFKQLNNSTHLLEVYSGFGNFFNIDGFNNYNFGLYFVNTFPGVVEAKLTKEEMLSIYGFTMIGELPKADNEIAITKYISDYFLTSGLWNSDRRVDTVEDLIGENLNINTNLESAVFKITGIIDTNLKNATFEEHKTRDSEVDYSKLQESKEYKLFRAEVENGFHSLAFVNSGFIERTGSKEVFSIDENQNKIFYVDRDRDNDALVYINKNRNVLVDNIDKSTIFRENYTKVFFDKNKTKLEKNEILLPSVFLGSTTEAKIEEYVLEYCYNFKNVPQAIKEMDLETLYNVFGKYTFTSDNATASSTDISNAYFLWLKYSANDDDVTFGDKMTLIHQLTLKAVAEELALKSSDDFDVSIRSTKSNITTETNLKVAGFFTETLRNQRQASNFNYYAQNYDLLISQKLVEELGLETYGIYNSLVGKMPLSQEEISDLTKSVYTHNEVKYLFTNVASSDLIRADRGIGDMIKLFLYVAIGLAVFSMLLMMNYISASITYKKKDIGILRSMGARGIDIFAIFFNEALILSLINFLLAVIGTFCGVWGIDLVIKNDMSLDIALFNVTIVQVLFVLAISFVSAVISSFLPVHMFSKKQPVEAIRNTVWT